MSEPFLSIIDVRLLARQKRVYRGEIDLRRMPRLVAGLSSNEGFVETEIVFGIDPQGVEYIRGQANVRAQQICQRCLEPMNTPLYAEWRLGLVESEQASGQLPAGYDAMVIPEEGITLAQLVEDELILSLPIVSMHDMNDCAVQTLQFGEPASGATGNEVRENPFAILSSLKTKK